MLLMTIFEELLALLLGAEVAQPTLAAHVRDGKSDSRAGGTVPPPAVTRFLFQCHACRER